MKIEITGDLERELKEEAYRSSLYPSTLARLFIRYALDRRRHDKEVRRALGNSQNEGAPTGRDPSSDPVAPQRS